MIHLSKIKSALGLGITAAALLALTGCVAPLGPGPGPEGHGGHHHHHHMHGPDDGHGPERGPM
ncbi:hypothetical protein [Neisseria oralis]|uniref:hypothetical protein n=1 Tax=Neisseria oralis TaxID=1107316 RepID=UPI0027E00281|nr:hypothetical protein [Neisseria oralis]